MKNAGLALVTLAALAAPLGCGATVEVKGPKGEPILNEIKFQL